MGIFPSHIESRSRYGPADDHWYGGVGQATKSGTSVSEKTSLKYLTMWSCVTLISGDIARLPLIMYRRRADSGKERVLDHALYDLLHSAPNPEMNSFQFRETSQGHQLLWGNSYSEKITAPRTGEIKALIPIDPGGMTVKRAIGTGRIYYEWQDKLRGPLRRWKDDIFHIPGFGFNGLIGLSNVAYARETIGMGLALEEFGQRYFGDGTHAGGVISMPAGTDLGNQKDKYEEALSKQYTGLGKTHKLMLFQMGETFTPLTINMDDAQFIESRKFNKVEICGMYHVPPHKIAVHDQNSNYNNLEQENASYVDSCLMHWIVRWEQSISQQLLTEEERKSGLFFEFLVDGLLRGDSKARSEFYSKMFAVGSMSQNDIRAKENQNPITGGDQYFVPLNLIPSDQAGDFKNEGRSIENRSAEREARSITSRDRIARRYRPLILRAAEKIVALEVTAVQRKVNKFRKQRAAADMLSWLDDFYRDYMPEKIKREIGPVLMSYAGAIEDAGQAEIGVGSGPDFERFMVDYVDRYAVRHTSSSRRQLSEMLTEDGAAGFDQVAERTDEWTETRPEKITDDEVVRAGSAIFQALAWSAGLPTYWRIRGAETCPYCTELNGRRVKSGQTFVDNDQELQPEGNAPMTIRGKKAHPPLHRGCDCYLTAG